MTSPIRPNSPFFNNYSPPPPPLKRLKRREDSEATQGMELPSLGNLTPPALFSQRDTPPLFPVFQDLQPLWITRPTAPPQSSGGRDLGLNPFYKKALDILKSNVIQYNGQTVPLNPQPIGSGAFKEVFEIAPGVEPLLDFVKNEQLLVSVFKERAILGKGRENKYKLSHAEGKLAHTNVVKQYETLKSLGFPVAQIYNTEEIINSNCGYFLVERIPNKLIIWKPQSEIAKLSSEEKELLDKIKGLFQKVWNSGIIVDFKPDNLMVRANGEIVLVDFRENKEPDGEEELGIWLPSMIQSFGCPQGSEIYKHLDPRPSL